jgi:hypothetical protein
MNCSVNLVPTARLHAHARTRRRNRWLAACASLAVLVAIGWSVQHAAQAALARLAEDVSALELQRSEVQRRLVSADAQRTHLLQRLEIVSAARRPQPWAGRLVRLTREAPEGVFLTSLDITATDGDNPATRNAAPPRPAPVATGRETGKPAGTPPTDTAGKPPSQAVRVLGYALDHAALLQFVNTLQRLPGWQQVELVRATQDPLRGGQAIAFELDCRALEEDPQ